MSRVLVAVALGGVLFSTSALGAVQDAPPPDKPATSQPAPLVDGIDWLDIQDHRTDRDLRSYPVSANFFSCLNGVWNLGDRVVAEDRIARMEVALSEAFGEAVRGKSLVVERYAISVNRRAVIEGMAAGASPGLVSDVMVRGQPDPRATAPTLSAKCEQERMEVGWFGTGEITNNFSPIVIEIDVELDGEPYSARAVFSPWAEAGHLVARRRVEPTLTIMVQEAMVAANKNLVAAISDAGAFAPD